MINRKPITREGYALLKTKLDHMINIELPKALEDIITARGHGDLSENGDYDAARSHKSFLEDQIMKIQNYLTFAKPVKPVFNGKATFGLKVHLKCLSKNEKDQSYIIVGEREEAIEKGSISSATKFASLFINQGKGFEFEIKDKRYCIEDITVPTSEEILNSITVR